MTTVELLCWLEDKPSSVQFGLTLNDIFFINFGRAPCGWDIDDCVFPADWDALVATAVQCLADCDQEVFAKNIHKPHADCLG